jgi:5-methylcytosine-specific restriction endonuclease McrA
MSYSTKYKQLRKAILKRDDYICSYCGQEATTVDHIIPISKGGVDHESNLTSACTTCNYGKKDRDAKIFLEKKFAERFTKIKKKNDFFAHDLTRTHSFVALSPRNIKNYDVFQLPEMDKK